MAGNQDLLTNEASPLLSGQQVETAPLPWRLVKSMPGPVTTALTLEALLQRWFGQLLHSIEAGGTATISTELRKKLSIGVPFAAMLLTLAAHGYNHRHQSGSKYPAAENYLAALFSSSFFFTLYGVFSSNQASLPLGWVITLCLAMPASIFFLKSTIPLSSYQSVRHINFVEATIPPQQRSTLENVWNGFWGAFLGAAPALVFSVIIRELQCGSVPLELPAMVVSGLVSMAGVASGYNLTRYPEQYAYLVTVMEVLAKAALSYTAVSGILSMMLSAIASKGCEDMSAQERAGFSVLCAAFAMMAGVYTGLHTQVRFIEKHLGFIKTLENIKWVIGGVQYGISKVASTVCSCPSRVWSALFRARPDDVEGSQYESVNAFEDTVNGFELINRTDVTYAEDNDEFSYHT